jgi:hypothetical protein
MYPRQKSVYNSKPDFSYLCSDLRKDKDQYYHREREQFQWYEYKPGDPVSLKKGSFGAPLGKQSRQWLINQLNKKSASNGKKSLPPKKIKTSDGENEP